MKEYRNFKKGICKSGIRKEYKILKTDIEYSARDFFGPSIKLKETITEGKIPTVEPLLETYRCEETSISTGAENLIQDFAKEYYKKYGSFYLISNFGEILINSDNVEEIIKSFKLKISIF